MSQADISDGKQTPPEATEPFDRGTGWGAVKPPWACLDLPGLSWP